MTKPHTYPGVALASLLVFAVSACAPPPPVELPAPAPPAPVRDAGPADTLEVPEVEHGEVAPTEPLRVEARWTAHAPLPQPRTEVSVATDGERIYLAGGFAAGEGEERSRAPRTLWAYSPNQDAWTAIDTIPEGVHHAALAFVNGRLYLIGGFGGTSFDPVASVWIYELATGEWRAGAPMPTPRGAAGFTVLDGRIHVIGGNVASPEAVEGQEGVRITEDRSVNVHEAYDPATDAWTRLAPMPTPRNHLGAATLNRRIHAVAGRADGHFTMTNHEIYDPATNAWFSGPPLPTGRSGIAVVSHEGRVYVFGGETFGENQRTFAEAERFDPAANRWELLPAMPTARHGLGAAPYGQWIYVISGGPQPGLAFGGANERLELETPAGSAGSGR